MASEHEIHRRHLWWGFQPLDQGLKTIKHWFWLNETKTTHPPCSVIPHHSLILICIFVIVNGLTYVDSIVERVETSSFFCRKLGHSVSDSFYCRGSKFMRNWVDLRHKTSLANSSEEDSLYLPRRRQIQDWNSQQPAPPIHFFPFL